MEKLKNVLVEFGFQQWMKSTPPDGCYVRVVKKGVCWIMKSTEDDCDNDFTGVVNSLTGDDRKITVKTTAIDSGSSFLEEGVIMKSSDFGQIAVSKSPIKRP
jgi:hypothetical protein